MPGNGQAVGTKFVDSLVQAHLSDDLLFNRQIQALRAFHVGIMGSPPPPLNELSELIVCESAVPSDFT